MKVGVVRLKAVAPENAPIPKGTEAKSAQPAQLEGPLEFRRGGGQAFDSAEAVLQIASKIPIASDVIAAIYSGA